MTHSMMVEQRIVLPAPGIPCIHRDAFVALSHLINCPDLMNHSPVVRSCFLRAMVYKGINGSKPKKNFLVLWPWVRTGVLCFLSLHHEKPTVPCGSQSTECATTQERKLTFLRPIT